MHFDLMHAIITIALIFATYWVLGRVGVIADGEKRRFDWRVVVALTLVVFIFNLIWPA